MSRNGDRRRAGRYVAARRGALGMTQEELAKAAEVDGKTIWSLEKGERWPIQRNRARIERALQWREGDLDVVASDGFPSSGPLPGDDPTGIIESARNDSDEVFYANAKAIIDRLPERERAVMEELLEDHLHALRQNERLKRRLVGLPQTEPPPDGDDDGDITGPHAVAG